MITYQPDHRFAERLLDVDDGNWPLSVVMASLVVQEATGDDQEPLAIGLIAARRRGDDLTTFTAKLVLWELGAYADFIERLERAVGKTAVGSVAG